MRLALQEIVRLQADPEGNHDPAWYAALASAALGAPTNRDADLHLNRLWREAPVQSRVDMPGVAPVRPDTRRVALRL